MKNLILTILIATIINNANSQWIQVGSNLGFTGSGKASLSFNPSTNEPFVAYPDAGSNSFVVKKFDGNSWISVGGNLGFTSDLTPSLAFNPITNEPFIAYTDGATNSYVVQKFDGTSWIQVGSNISSSSNGSPSLVFNTITNEPYIAYCDELVNAYVIRRFDGSSWVQVGSNQGFGSNGNPIIDFNPLTNEPYIAYFDAVLSSGIVKKYNGSSWIQVGSGLTNSNNSGATLSFNPITNQPYIGYVSGGLKKFNGIDWELVMPIAGNGSIPAVCFNSLTGQEFIAFAGWWQSALQVLTYNGNSSVWQNVGNFGITTQSASQTLKVKPLTNELYVVYADVDADAFVVKKINSCIPVLSTQSVITCDSYTWIDGVTYTSSNNTATYTFVGGSLSGCDSIVTLDLSINESSTSTDFITACDSYTWIDGVTYTSSNNTATFNIVGGAANANGCDEIVTLNLTINEASTGTDVITACSPYTWIDGVQYSSSNNTATYTLVGGASNGCDSIVTLDLTINEPVTGSDVVFACDSFTWIDGYTYMQNDNTATYTLVGGAANGCDSIVTLDLTIGSVTGTDIITACSSYTWIDGVTYTSSNNTATYTLVGGSASGCDSIVTLDLTIGSVLGTDIVTACSSYTWIDGITYTSSNNTATYTLVGGSSGGCDSIVTLDLTIGSVLGTDIVTACSSYTWIDGITYTSSNNTATYTIVGGASNGCDSIVSLDLTLNNASTGTDVITACNYYTWIDGFTYSSSNNTATYTIVGGASNGCDSIITLDLTIVVSDLSISTLTTSTGTTVSAINSEATYQWLDCSNNFAVINGETDQSFVVESNGNYSVELTENGCVDTSDCVLITMVDLMESSFVNKLHVYPNPTQGEITIEFDSFHENIDFVITNLLGQLIDHKIYTNCDSIYFSIDEPSGIYFVTVNSGQSSAIIRLVKE